jgi:hypothetical protein
MKQIKLLFLTLFAFIGLNASSQVLNSFNLYILNNSSCQYTLIGSYYGNGISGTIMFNPQPSGDYYIGVLPGVDSLTINICAIYAPPCIGEQCLTQMIYVGPGQGVSTFTLLLDVGVDELTTNNIKTWPNPVVGMININTPSNSGMMRIYAVDGSCVYENNYFSSTFKIDSDILTEGTYIITLVDDNGMFYTTKIMK